MSAINKEEHIIVGGRSILNESNFVTTLLFLAIVLSLPQIYAPFVSISRYSPPIALLLAGALGIMTIPRVRMLLRHPLAMPVAGLCIWYATALAWSPDKRMAFRIITYCLVFIIVFVATYHAAINEKTGILNKALEWLCYFGIIEAALVIAFRVSPAVEAEFLRSHIASLFINPNSLSILYTSGKNNVLSLDKAGGLFLNANVASAYLGALFWIALSLWYCSGRVRFACIAGLMWTSVFFTGSKAGALIAFALPVVVILVCRQLREHKGIAAMGGWLDRAWTGALAAFIGTESILNSAIGGVGLGSFFGAIHHTLVIREKIWAVAWREFVNHPVTGLGVGGWDEVWPHYAVQLGLPTTLPPHNSLLIAATEAGAPALLLSAGVIVCILSLGIRAVRCEDRRTVSAGVALLGAYGWVVIESMGTNYGVIGEMHAVPVIAALSGWVAVELKLKGRTKSNA